ncbi:hypothetical protein FKG94_17095 [Exilibacterium tricleocarpae]|uniref:Flagellar biosynthetic protein FliO n=1 Tax=Exilibacterium tricleocarpae TaxID=2591008 RepID=A0A545T878_9GAMM|nr:hypothetical protein [Exilibacterium tricleocarpae]TQV73420.1 hypothetical protein FKG94_17095 [Exilibacterium tricleocarpae]
MVRSFTAVLISALLSVSVAGVAARAAPAAERADPPPAIPFKQTAGAEGIGTGRLLLAFSVMLAAVVGGVILVRKTVANPDLLRAKFPHSKLVKSLTDQRISLLSVKRVSPKISVYLLAVDNKEYLLVNSGTQSQLVLHGDGQKTAWQQHDEN